MSIVVFVGPSLPAKDVLAHLGARILPPAAVGDVLRAARAGPAAIALIDGAFDGVLPVWHKEILWAMAQGVHVFGAASMGALRAAELDGFGMRGIGGIYGAYKAGQLEADDEVAVLHGPAEVGYAAVTEALVNVRATVERAARERVLDAEEAEALLRQACATHYRDRSWDGLLAAMGGGPAARLRPWLATRRVDLKREDAAALVSALAVFARSRPPPMAVGYRFAWTDAWDALYREVAAGSRAEEVLVELRLQPGRYRAVRRTAMPRVLARQETERAGRPQGTADTVAAVERLRGRLGLWRRADLDRWLAASDLDERGFQALAEEEVLLEALEQEGGGALAVAILAELRLSGAYLELADRAGQKAERLAAAGLDDPAGAPVDVDPEPLLARLAASCEGAPADLPRQLGFSDGTALTQAVLREALFQRILSSTNGVDNAAFSARPDGSKEMERSTPDGSLGGSAG